MVTRNTLVGMQPGQVLTVITTCRAIKQKMSSLCETLDCTVLEMWEEDGSLSIQIQKKLPPSPAHSKKVLAAAG